MCLHRVACAILAGLIVSVGATCSAKEKAVRAVETTTKQPALVLRIASVDTLVQDARYLAEVVGKGEEAKQAEQFLKSFTGEKGLGGLDTSKPFGLYGHLEGQVRTSRVALLLPVSDETAFLDLLNGLNIKGEKDGDGVYKVELPGGQLPVYYRFANKYVYSTIAEKSNLDKEKLLPPERIFQANETGTLSLKINIDEVPDSVRTLVLGEAERRSAVFKDEKKKGETKAQKAFHGQLIDEMVAQTKVFLKEGKSLRLGLDIDRRSGDLSASVIVTAKPGSSMAESIANVGKTKSISASLLSPESALSMVVHVALPENLRKGLEPVIDEGLSKAHKELRDKDHKAFFGTLVKALVPTIKMGELDAGMSVRGPTAKGLYTIVLGMKVKDGAKIDEAAREMLKKAPMQLQEQVTLDADKSGNTSIHKIKPIMVDTNTKELLGDNPVYIAIRADAVLLAAGDEGLQTLKDVLMAAPVNSKVVRFEAAMARLAPFLAREHKNAPAAAKEAFAKDKDSDKVLIVLEGGNALRLRASAKAQILRFFALIEEMNK
jgi:hypothetical protein